MCIRDRYKDGTLIGTAVGLNQMLARLVNVTGCSEATAIRTATENPASILGLAKKTGAIQAGYDADMVLLEEDFTVYATVVGGRIVYRRESD